METKHLTIMFTDIKGFTSRTSMSSREQLNKMLELHEELILPVFKQFKGNVVKTIGDAFLVTFHSPTDAVLCGMKIQEVLEKHNEKVPREEQLEVRVAINSGEVTIKGNDVYGEAVNIASRLEGIADAGDIYFTESVYLSMNKSEIPTAAVGYRHFKGIPEEVKVYKVLRETGKKKKGIFRKKEKAIARNKVPFRRKAAKYGKYVLLAFVLIVIISQCNRDDEQDSMPMLQQQESSKEPRVGELKQELQDVYFDVKNAIDEGDERRANKGLDYLREMNERLGYPENLENAIRDLEMVQEEQMGSRAEEEDDRKEENIEDIHMRMEEAVQIMNRAVDEDDEPAAAKALDMIHQLEGESGDQGVHDMATHLEEMYEENFG